MSAYFHDMISDEVRFSYKASFTEPPVDKCYDKRGSY